MVDLMGVRLEGLWKKTTSCQNEGGTENQVQMSTLESERTGEKGQEHRSSESCFHRRVNRSC